MFFTALIIELFKELDNNNNNTTKNIHIETGYPKENRLYTHDKADFIAIRKKAVQLQICYYIYLEQKNKLTRTHPGSNIINEKGKRYIIKSLEGIVTEKVNKRKKSYNYYRIAYILFPTGYHKCKRYRNFLTKLRKTMMIP